MGFQTLDEWLAWQEGLHARRVDLGLERVGWVAEAMGLDHPSYRVVTVAGTNGKGSCVALLHSTLSAAGYRVGAYTSPHLLRYNERVRVGGAVASDAQLCRAFARIDDARRDVALTYFEYGTLAALDVFREAQVDIALLEVGMGGRLDATNVVDADVAVVAALAVDHVDWLGPDRETIAREKAGIFRPRRPAVCGDPDPPRSLLAHAAGLSTPLYRVGVDFDYRSAPESWEWHCGSRRRGALPFPALTGEFQLRNAAAVLMALELLADHFPVSQDDVRRGLQEVQLAGRFQVIPGPVERILDVAHNPQAAEALAANLARRPCGGRTLAVVALLGDKDIEGVVVALDLMVHRWLVADLPGPRAVPVAELASRIRRAGVRGGVSTHPGVEDALERAQVEAQPGDRIVIFGSFRTVEEALRVDERAARARDG
ncbi:MAG: bifunctional tetrahydrofolate synthase/dihydrofolate synthase [Chromatiales bacterium 21-64-14]|nr:MAG: bifunctional tetrahydrofolate synthase/dihydrofolate synthase [Chromatiales bacterium 21-64-14]HQU15527.1 bifunctional tetrahydrofolate synthase/dihydrofolate synthase [Gammaproteobacteria bacterium]